jgi:hypothetical protein
MNVKRMAALGVALSMTAGVVGPAAAEGWNAGKLTTPTANVEQVKMKKHGKKHPRFERHGNYAYYNGHRGDRHRHPGWRYYNGYWFPPAAFLAAIIGGAILLSH